MMQGDRLVGSGHSFKSADNQHLGTTIERGRAVDLTSFSKESPCHIRTTSFPRALRSAS
jgi:hypothetical protein